MAHLNKTKPTQARLVLHECDQEIEYIDSCTKFKYKHFNEPTQENMSKYKCGRASSSECSLDVHSS